jgi:hypothetical protein
LENSQLVCRLVNGLTGSIYSLFLSGLKFYIGEKKNCLNKKRPNRSQLAQRLKQNRKQVSRRLPDKKLISDQSCFSSPVENTNASSNPSNIRSAKIQKSKLNRLKRIKIYQIKKVKDVNIKSVKKIDTELCVPEPVQLKRSIFVNLEEDVMDLGGCHNLVNYTEKTWENYLRIQTSFNHNANGRKQLANSSHV